MGAHDSNGSQEDFSPDYLESLLKDAAAEAGKSSFSDRERAKRILAKVPIASFQKFGAYEYVAVSPDSVVVDGDQNEFQLAERTASRGLECLIVFNPKFPGRGPQVLP